MSASLAAPAVTAALEPPSGRACVRPGCDRRATTTLRFDYAERTVTLDPLGSDTEPGEYDLCLRHAARSTPPTGWTLRDRAPSPPPASEPAPPVGPDRGQGVARLAAALSAVPRAVSEDAPDAAPVGTDRPVERTATTVRERRSPLDGLIQPSPSVLGSVEPQARVRPVPLSERMPQAEVRPVPQPLRLAPDPTTTVWCADLLVPADAHAAEAGPADRTGVQDMPRPLQRDVRDDDDRHGAGGAPTLFV